MANGSGGGPPNKWTAFDATGMTADQLAAKLSDLWAHGFTGPVAVVGNLVAVAGYKK